MKINNSKTILANERKVKREIVRVKKFVNDSWEFPLDVNLLKLSC